jgi:dienelactone hydrolase
MALTEKPLEYMHGQVRFEGLLVAGVQGAERRPGVIVAHAWGGRGDFEATAARRLAEQGYVAFALDMFGKGVRGGTREQNAALIAPLLRDRSLLQARMLAAVGTLREQAVVDPARIAAIGFCFGGLCVLDLARTGADVAGVVSLHGLFTPPEPEIGARIRARVLALHGHDDPMVPPMAVAALEAELTAAGADWQIHVYGGTMHAFTNPQARDRDFGTVYSEVAARRAWAATDAFLAETLAHRVRP